MAVAVAVAVNPTGWVQKVADVMSGDILVESRRASESAISHCVMNNVQLILVSESTKLDRLRTCGSD